MKQNSPKISIVIPNYNDSRIKRTLDSIVNQTYNNFQIIIVDGGSTNIEVLNIYDDYRSFIDKLKIEPDKGIFDALNKGIKLASGELIYLLGSDDVLSDIQCFHAVIDLYQKDTDVDGISIACRFVNANKKIIREWKTKKISSKKIKWGLMPPHFSLFLKKEVYDEVGFFNFEKTYIASDTEWLIRFANKKNINIPFVRNHFLDMEYGGASTGSIKYILKAIIIIGQAARKNNVKQWPFTPLVKLFSKLFQLRYFSSKIV